MAPWIDNIITNADIFLDQIPQCSSPEDVKGEDIASLDTSQFVCKGDREFPTYMAIVITLVVGYLFAMSLGAICLTLRKRQKIYIDNKQETPL